MPSWSKNQSGSQTSCLRLFDGNEPDKIAGPSSRGRRRATSTTDFPGTSLRPTSSSSFTRWTTLAATPTMSPSHLLAHSFLGPAARGRTVSRHRGTIRLALASRGVDVRQLCGAFDDAHPWCNCSEPLWVKLGRKCASIERLVSAREPTLVGPLLQVRKLPLTAVSRCSDVNVWMPETCIYVTTRCRNIPWGDRCGGDGRSERCFIHDGSAKRSAQAAKSSSASRVCPPAPRKMSRRRVKWPCL